MLARGWEKSLLVPQFSLEGPSCLCLTLKQQQCGAGSALHTPMPSVPHPCSLRKGNGCSSTALTVPHQLRLPREKTPPRNKESTPAARTRKTPHLRLELGLLPLQSLHSFHQDRNLSEGQEPGHVGGSDGHHVAILVQHLAHTEPLRVPQAPPLVHVPLLIPFKPTVRPKETP